MLKKWQDKSGMGGRFNRNTQFFDKVGIDTQAEKDMSKSDPMERINKLKQLKDSGVITEEEFNEKKNKILGMI